MKMRYFLMLMTCASLHLCSKADTLVAAGATLSVTNVEELGFSPIQLGEASTLAFVGASAGTGGLNEYTRTGAGGIGTPGITSYGTLTRITTNAFWAGTNFVTNNVEYIYTGRWHIPADGLYSVYEHIDDAALIAVDGRTLLVNSQYNAPTCVRNIALTAGWHDLELRLFNNAFGGGIMSTNLASGLLFSPSNDLISVTNQTNAYPFADTGDGSTLLSVHNGWLFQKLFVANQATLDLSAHGMDVPLSLTASLLPAYTASGAKLTVAGGTGELYFGTPNQGAQFTPFNADVAFTGVAAPVGVTFRDFSTLITVPTSCAWRVANNATIALYGTNLFGSGDIVLTNYNVYLLSPFAAAPEAVVRVQGTNLTAALKPCSVDSNGWWTGWPITLTNDVALEGTGSTALFPINVDLYMQGKITGTGTVTKTGNARTEILEPSTFVGPVSCSDLGTFVFRSDTAGHSNNTVTVGAGSTFAFYPTGYGTTDTTAWIQTLRGGGISGKVFVPARQTLTVDYLEGALKIEGAGASLHINTLGTNAVLSVTGQMAVTLDSAAPGASLTLAGPATPLSVTGSGVTLDALTLTSGTVPIRGDFTVNLLGGGGTLLKQGSETLRVLFSTNTAGVKVDAGQLVLAPPAPETVLGSLPALWLDATASNVFTQYKSYAFTNGFINIERWNDRRPGAPYYGFNSRGNDNQQVYPYVMTDNQNGLPVVSMGSYQLILSPPYIGPEGGGIEARRLPLSTNLYPQYAVMMFGSQQGGGAAVLGGDPTFNRAGGNSNDFRNPATPILTNAGIAVWTNGVAVTATNTGFSGGYQILSVNTKGLPVNALGWRIDNTTAGGQNYGEVLLYTNALTLLQRMTAEAYLAAKWGLPYPYVTPLATATVAAGATLEIGGAFSIETLYGAGNLTVATASAFTLSGLFTGTVTLSGGSALSIPDLPAPPGDEAVPASSLTGWYDPSLTNRIVLGGAYTPSRPLNIAAVYDRTTTSRYLLGTCPSDMSFDRRPYLAVTNGPWGTPIHWLDYTNVYSGDLQGNTLRMYRDPAYIGTSDTTHVTPTNVQSGFIVLDSSRGAGVPITYNVTASSVVTRDNPQSYTSPIWGTNTTWSLKSGQTYLDGVSVNGAGRGYNGTTEVLSFVATNTFQAAFFGYYGGSDGANAPKNRERLGEIILFESALSTNTRAGIEAYLMKKWLGKVRSGFSDATAATVTGSGTVTAVLPQQLPALSESFTGTVALTGTAFDYTLTTNTTGQYVVTPVTVIPGGLTVAASGAVNVTFGVRPPAGTYTLIRYESVTGQGFINWTLTTAGNLPTSSVKLVPTGTALKLRITSPGTLFMVH